VFTENTTLANPCYVINPPMAKRLLDGIKLEGIRTLSDVYVHRDIVKKYSDIVHLTVWPMPVFELSRTPEEFKYKKKLQRFKSTIAIEK